MSSPLLTTNFNVDPVSDITTKHTEWIKDYLRNQNCDKKYITIIIYNDKMELLMSFISNLVLFKPTRQMINVAKQLYYG